MSSGLSISGIALLVELAWSTIDGARNVFGEHDDLTRELSGSYMTLHHLHSEVEDPESVFNFATGGRRKDFETHIAGCRRHLERISSVLSREEIFQMEDGQAQRRLEIDSRDVKHLSRSQLRLSMYTSAIALTLNLLSLGSQGGVERELGRLRGDGKRLRMSINMLVAKKLGVSRGEMLGGSMLSSSHEERKFCRSLRRDLVKEGFQKSLIHTHKHLIQDYVKELGDRGILNGETFNLHSSPDFEHRQRDEHPQRVEPQKRGRSRQPAPKSTTTSSASRSDHSNRTSTTSRSKPKMSLSSLLFSSKNRKHKRADTSPQQSPQPRKRHRRAPPTPRSASPTPEPPAWWLEERLRRRPAGWERGRSPPPRGFADEGYGRSMDGYDDALMRAKVENICTSWKDGIGSEDA